MKSLYWLFSRSKTELGIVFATLFVLITLPIISVIVLASSGIAVASDALASINSTTHTVEIKDPNGNIITSIEATTSWPVCGVITTEFGVPDLPAELHHTGLDIANNFGKVGNSVTPFMYGIVIQVIDSKAGLGKHIIIDHGNGITSVYGHLSELLVEKGDPVGPGNVIGLEGSTGASTGPHLHFTIKISGIPVNPHLFMIGHPQNCIK